MMPATGSPRIVIHVGALKTASTYLQRRMRANLATLRQHGIYLPVLPVAAEMAGNAKLLTTALNGRATPMFQRAFPKIDVKTLDPVQVLAQLLEGWRSDKESVVLSDENLRKEHAPLLRELLPSSALCVVVLFVRRQDRWIDSYFNQLVKTNQSDGDLPEFVRKMCAPDDATLFRPDWYSHYEAWRNAFGHCNIVFYDEAGSDIFSAFLSAAGFQSVPGLADIEPAQVSLSAYELAYLLALERPVIYDDFLRRRSAMEKATRRVGRTKPKSLLTNADLALLCERFDESNRRLLAELRIDTDRSPLKIDRASGSDLYCDLGQLYKSDSYRQYRDIVESIYLRRNRRRRWNLFARGLRTL
jgi:hypothetical protein